MDNTALLYVIAAFVFIAAVALCIQAGMLFGMYKTAKLLESRVVPLLPKLEALVEAARTTIEHSRKQIVEISAKANEILDSTRTQMVKVEEVVSDATARAKVQMDRVELVLDDTMGRAQHTVSAVHNGIMRPVREIHGIAAAVKATVLHLARGNRPSVAQATSDEEMFI